MIRMSLNDFLRIPEKLKVRVTKDRSGVFTADILGYDIFTHAESVDELDQMINDLLMVFFDVPKKFHDKIVFIRRKSPITKVDLNSSIVMRKFLSPEIMRLVA